MKLKNIVFITLIILAEFGLIFTTGCGSSGAPDEIASIDLTVGSLQVNGDGTSSVTITATVLDGAGQSVTPYTDVYFTTTLGNFINKEKRYKATIIDNSGTVTVSLISPTEPGIAQVTCESSGMTQSKQVNFSKTASIVLSSNFASIPADGIKSVQISAYITESNGSPIVQNTEITFTTTAGLFSNGQKTYKTATLDGSGKVTVSLIAPTTPGIAEVLCSSNGVTQSMNIYFTHYDNSGMPVGEAFSLSLEYHNISGLWMSGLSDTISAYLGDVNGTAVQDGVPVYFKTYNTGGFLDPNVAVTGGMINDNTTTQSGTAVTTLYSNQNPTPVQGMVSVTAETDGGETTHITSIAVTPENDSNILYAGTNGGGVYKSTDSGRNWGNISKSTLNPRAGQNWISPYIKGNSAICVDPDDHNTVYVGTGYGGEGNLFRSLDGGMNWNSNNSEEWFGLYSTEGAVLTVLCDDDGKNDDDDTNYVWIGTEGKGILYANDGETFEPAGGIINITKTSGRGEIISQKLGYSAQTETWTLKCIIPKATANSASVIDLKDGDTAQDQDSIIVEENSYTPAPVLNSTANPFPDGRIDDFKTTTYTKTEEWTVKYVKGTIAEPIIISAPKGSIININPKQVEEEETWTLTCIYVDINQDQLLKNDTSTIFKVEGLKSGTLKPANVNTSYSSTVIDFTIVPGEIPFIVGDVITFKTVPKIKEPYWQVSGSISGMQANKATTDVAYTSDKQDDKDKNSFKIGFTIFNGTIPFTIGDSFTFKTYEARPSYWTVSGSKSGMQAGIAQTNQLYKSDNGEISFKIKEGDDPFKDEDIIKLDVTVNKVGHGWTVWDIVKVPNTHQNSAVLYAGTDVGVYKSTNGGKTWDSTGRFTGDYIKCLELYHAASGTDILYAGTENGAVWASINSGRTWTQYPIDSDKGTNIKDILLDRLNHTLYAVAWYGSEESATGKIFAHSLKEDYTMKPSASWYETNEGLSGAPIYAIAADNPSSTSELYAGGNGIGFYRTSGSMSSALPVWVDSSNGLTNTIMARIPVLFSSEAHFSYNYIQYENIVFLDVYLQDLNGNPPIAGSTFKVVHHSESAGEDYEKTNIVYSDSYFHQGTFRNPANAYTNYPYRYTFAVGSGDDITITYMLKCNTENAEGAGCSGGGGEETRTFSF